MNFFASFIWHYDPYGIILEMRVKNKNIPYVQTSRPKIENFTNQTEWEPNTLVEIEQQALKYHLNNSNYIPRGQKLVRHLTFLV